MGKFKTTSRSKAHSSSSPLEVRHHPPVYQGKHRENKATTNPSPAAQPHHTLPLQRISSTKPRCKVKPPANFEFKPIYQHFKKSVQTDKPGPNRTVIQTVNSDVLTPPPQDKDKDREGKFMNLSRSKN